MTTLKVLVVDDENLARERLIRLIEGLEQYEICGQAENGDQALTFIHHYQPDIVLLDIRMPGKDGLEVAQQITQLEHPPGIIFCTAYDEYAINAFKFNAIDYLLKPVRREALSEALTRTGRLSLAQLKSMAQTQLASDEATLIANTWQGQELIPLKDVYFIAADQKYLNITHSRGECISDQTLKKLEFDYPNTLLRIHRNALVNVNFIEALKKTVDGQQVVKIRGTEHELTVSRRHVPDVKKWLAKISP